MAIGSIQNNFSMKRTFETLFFISIFSTLLIFISNSSFAQHGSEIKNINRPNILWITCEDMSLHLSSFGEKTIRTPNLDALAEDGVKYSNVYTCAGVCAPSRNGIITAMYPQSIGGDNMRNYQPGKKDQEITNSKILPSYSIIPPTYLKCFPEYLRKENYYCTNNPKEDYQFEAPITTWDESSNKAHWRNRPAGSPFFSVFNLAVTHESQLWLRDSLALEVDPAFVKVPSYYPDNKETRHAIARQLSNVLEMDRQAGAIIKELKDSGLYENTIVFFFSDHGDGLPYVKREILERGLHIPLIIKFPNKLNAGKIDDQLVSAIDLGPTVLSLAGIPIPKYMSGQAFLGDQKAEPRKYIFAARDRMDEEVDRVRTVFDGRYQYIHNYMPEKPAYQNIVYRLQIPMMKKIIELKDSGKLSSLQMRWFKKKSADELYDLKSDPNQYNNLASNPAFAGKLGSLKKVYENWIHEVGDLHELSEIELRNKMWEGAKSAPETALPELIKIKNGYQITCSTHGASIGYIIKRDSKIESVKKESWKIYQHEILILNKGDKIMIKAHRIGFAPSELNINL